MILNTVMKRGGEGRLTLSVDQGLNDVLVSVNGGQVKSCVTL